MLPPGSATLAGDDIWVEDAKLLASDGMPDDFFGSGVAFSGDTVLVGAPGPTDVQGAAYVMVRNGDEWIEQAKLTASDGHPSDLFGFGGVALSDDTALVGAWGANVDGNNRQGAVYVFVRSDGQWHQQAKLTAADGEAEDIFGVYIALSGDTALIVSVNAVSDTPVQGAAYVFTRDGETWSQQAKLTLPAPPTGEIGTIGPVDLSEDTAVVGMGGGIPPFGDAVYVFTRGGEDWSLQTRIDRPDDGASANRGFGNTALAIHGDSLAVGEFTRVAGNLVRRVLVYVRDGTGGWSEQARLTEPDNVELLERRFANSVAIDGDTIVVGAPESVPFPISGQRNSLDSMDDFPFGRGAAYVFTRSDGVWDEPVKLLASDGEEWDFFGGSGETVAIEGDTVLVSASGHEDWRGAVYAFDKIELPADVAVIEGTVRGLGHCDSGIRLVEDITVEIIGGESTYTLDARYDGYYRAFISDSENTVDIVVTTSNEGYVPTTVPDIALVGGEVAVQNITLSPAMPCAVPDPPSLEVELDEGQTATETLVLSNMDGAAALDWSINTAIPSVSPLPPAAPITNNGQQTTNNAFILSQPAPGTRPINPAGGVVDCEDEPGIVSHDDGTIESVYAGNPEAGITEVIFVDRFTPASYPGSFRAVCVAFVALESTSLDFEVVLFADDGPGGAPGRELGAVAARASEVPGLPIGDPAWISVDISSLNITIDSGSVYIGVRWPISQPVAGIAADQSDDRPTGIGAGYWWNDDSDEWAPLVAGFSAYRALFVRAVGDHGNCHNPSDIPWLTIEPTSGTVPARGTGEVQVTFNASGLALGDYQASICIYSNDPLRSLLAVAVSLTVNEGGKPPGDEVFQDKFETGKEG